MRMASKVTRSTGNVFRDIGFSKAESQRLLIKSELMTSVLLVMQRRRLTQAEAAKLFGVTQPRMSDLARGKIDLFSIDGLIGMLTHAGLSVRVTVRAAKRGSSAA